MAQHYPDNHFDRKSRRPPKWAFFKALLGRFDQAAVASVNGYIAYPGMETDEARRQKLQCEMDAVVAAAFKLTVDELERVLSNGRFHRVAESTKLQVLEIFSELTRDQAV